MARAVARGELRGGVVEVPDPRDASRLRAKGMVGTVLRGGGLHLELVEAVHAVETGRLEVQGPGGVVGLDGLLGLPGPGGSPLEVHALAYRDLRERGLVVRPAGDGTHQVWRRAEGPPAPPWFEQRPLSERDAVQIGALAAWTVGAGTQGGADAQGPLCVVSVVDEDGGVTHYRLTHGDPRGAVAEDPALPPAEAVVLVDRVLVPDGDAAAAYRGQEGLGTPYAGGLVLSFTEAEALRRRGVLGAPADLPERAAARQHHFTRTWPVYADLRARGVLARSGFRFGTHLRGYRTDPDASHADWLLQCHFPDDTVHWSELSRAVRLAHGVRKSFLVAVAGDGRVGYVGLEWFRP